MSWFWFACLFLFIFLLLASDWFESSNFFRSKLAASFFSLSFFFLPLRLREVVAWPSFWPIVCATVSPSSGHQDQPKELGERREGREGRGAVARELTTQTRQKAKQKSTQQKERSILLWYMSKLYLKDMRWAVEHTQAGGQAAPPPSHHHNSTTTTTTLAASSSSFDLGLEFIIRYRAQRDYILWNRGMGGQGQGPGHELRMSMMTAPVAWTPLAHTHTPVDPERERRSCTPRWSSRVAVFVFMAMAGGKIYLNCRWRSFFCIWFFCKKDFSFFSFFVILWNVLSSHLEWGSTRRRRKKKSEYKKHKKWWPKSIN